MFFQVDTDEILCPEGFLTLLKKPKETSLKNEAAVSPSGVPGHSKGVHT